MTKKRKRKKRKQITGRLRKRAARFLRSIPLFDKLVILLFFAVAAGLLHLFLFSGSGESAENVSDPTAVTAGEGNILEAEEGECGRPRIEQDFLTVNPYSRSGIALTQVKGIVVHYVANAGSTARENRDYFDNLKDTHTTKASSHFIVGLEGEIIQCIPLDEISYASNDRNTDTISIECCHPKDNGKFNKKTMASLVQLTAWLCDTYGLDSDDVIRHYDVTGKLCPKYYVKHPDAWEDFRKKIKKKIANA